MGGDTSVPRATGECLTINPGIDGYMEEAFITKYVAKGKVDANALRQHGKKVVRTARRRPPF